jgi:hypothetical protein
LVHSAFDFTLHTTSNALLFLVLAAMATLGRRVEEGGGQRRRRRRTQTTIIEPGTFGDNKLETRQAAE